MSSRPLILVSNDDGVDAAGIVALREALTSVADVITVAPEFEQSARSHAISLHGTLRHHRYSETVHSVEGTPAEIKSNALVQEAYLGGMHEEIHA